MEAIISRLKKIMAYYQLSSSGFADKVDVRRSSISHLLSGRNKPSLDFILKVNQTFEEVDLNWLLYGKGGFPKKNEMTPSLFTQKESEFTENEAEGQKKIKDIKTENRFFSVATSKSLVKIILLYDDGTFDAFDK